MACLRETLDDPRGCARLLAVSAEHGSEWLRALPIAACGLRMDDEAVRVAIGLRLGCELCEPHVCGLWRANQWTGQGIHGTFLHQEREQTISRHVYMIQRWLSAAPSLALIFTSTKRAQGTSQRSDAKRPDGLTLVPWSRGKMLTLGRHSYWSHWLPHTFATVSMYTPGAAAEAASAQPKPSNTSRSWPLIYLYLWPSKHWCPICMEGSSFLAELGHVVFPWNPVIHGNIYICYIYML